MSSLLPTITLYGTWGEAMKIKSLQSLLCVVMLATLGAEQTSQAEEPVSAGAPAQTLFAYRSSFGARLHDSLLGYSVLPSDVPVELTPLDPSALEHAAMNSTVAFRVVHNVVVGQYAYAYGGNLVEAKVTRIREGKLRIRRGRMEPRVMEVNAVGLIESSPPEYLKLRLESSPRSRSGRTAMKLVTFPLKVIGIVVITVPEDLLLAIACATAGCDL
jgi:hypothetical protein